MRHDYWCEVEEKTLKLYWECGESHKPYTKSRQEQRTCNAKNLSLKWQCVADALKDSYQNIVAVTESVLPQTGGSPSLGWVSHSG